MYGTNLRNWGWPVITAILLTFLIFGCGSDSPTNPTPNPDLAMSLACNNGLYHLTVQNTGGSMKQASSFVVAFSDGHADTLMMNVAGDSTKTCPISNVHGNAAVTNQEFNLQASADACLTEFLQGVLASYDLSSAIPSPFAQQKVVLCTYTVYLQHLTYNPPTVELIKRDSGLTLKCVYSNITCDLKATAPELLCPDLTGSVSISSIVITANINIVEGAAPQVTMGDPQTTVNGFQVNLDGAFGFILQTVINWFQGTFVSSIQDGVTNAINQAAPDLTGLMVPNSGCDE